MGRLATIIIMTIFLIMIPTIYAENYLVQEVELDTEGTALIQGKTNLDILTILDLEKEVINGYTAELTRKEGINWYFEYKTKEILEKYVVKLILPENTRINAVETTAKTGIEVENNRHVLIFTGKNESMNLKVQYSFKSTNREVSNIWMYTTIILTIMVIGLIIGSIYMKKKTITKKLVKEDAEKLGVSGTSERGKKENNSQKELKIDEEKLKTIRMTLNEAQLKILDTLQEKGGEASQTTIKYMTDLPKSSLSRNLEIMAQKNIISKHYNGTSNYIKIHPSLQTD